MSCCEIGAGKCYELAFTCEYCGHAVFVDKCLCDEIKELHARGIATLGCCCGHGARAGYIQVSPEFVDLMNAIGYEQQSESGDIGRWCFTPKTKYISEVQND